MAYVPGLDHDVFISYSTRDDYPAPNGWVTVFVERLREELDAAFGGADPSRIWWDRTHIDEEAELKEHIKERVQKSACLVVILSVAYQKSNWCLAERLAFLAGKHLEQDHERRVFLVDIGNLPWADRPKEFSNLRGRYFWKDDSICSNDEQKLRLGHPVPDQNNPAHTQFFGELNRLAGAIVARTKKIGETTRRFSTLQKLRADFLAILGKLREATLKSLQEQCEYDANGRLLVDFGNWLIETCSLGVATNALNEVHDTCGPSDHPLVGQLLDHLLPMKYCQNLDVLRDLTATDSIRLLESQAGYASIAEIIMAGIDCKPISYSSRRNGLGDSYGRTAVDITESPESGPDDGPIAPGPSPAARSWEVMNLLMDIFNAYVVQIQENSVSSTKHSDLTESNVVGKLSAWISSYSARRKRTVYALVRLPESPPQRARAVDAITYISKQIKSLVFFELVSRSEKTVEIEESTFQAVCFRQNSRQPK